MRKIPTLFERDWFGDRSRVTREVNPDALWVIDGEGVPTVKWDGTAVMIDESGGYWKRYEVKKGKTPPGGFLPADDPDPNTGKQQGWVRVDPNDPADKWHMEAWDRYEPGTYELVGPKVQGNPHDLDQHMLKPHGFKKCKDDPRTFDDVAMFLRFHPFEGIVWHHPDGRMVKVKARDFGIEWPRR